MKARSLGLLNIGLIVILLASLFLVCSITSQGVYDPWADINDDGYINIKDAVLLNVAFGSSGTPLTKASLEYDSGWINITDKCGQPISIFHDLNIVNWNDTSIVVDITGRTTAESGLLRNLCGQGYSPRWSQTYGGTLWEEANSLIQTVDGGYAIAGYTESFGAGNGDFWLVKTDASGNHQWNQTYGGTGGDGAYALVQTVDGGYAIAGYTFSFGAGSSDFWLVKTYSNGSVQWSQTYGGGSGDYAYALVQTVDGGYAIAGYTFSFGAGSSDFWLVKTYSNGSVQWSQTYGGTGMEYSTSMIQTSDSGYVLIGPTNSFGAGNDDLWLVKTDAAGNMQWNQTYGWSGDENTYVGNSVTQAGDGGYAIAGYTYSFGSPDVLLIKTDSNGNMQWNKTYGDSWGQGGDSIIQTDDGGYIVSGGTTSFDWHGDFWLIKTDAFGSVQWNKTYGGLMGEEAYCVIQTSDGGFALAGPTSSFSAGYVDFLLVKTESLHCGLAWTDSTADTITLYRGASDTDWNYVRVRIWKIKETP